MKKLSRTRSMLVINIFDKKIAEIMQTTYDLALGLWLCLQPSGSMTVSKSKSKRPTTDSHARKLLASGQSIASNSLEYRTIMTKQLLGFWPKQTAVLGFHSLDCVFQEFEICSFIAIFLKPFPAILLMASLLSSYYVGNNTYGCFNILIITALACC